jgi:hypothetical protein
MKSADVGAHLLVAKPPYATPGLAAWGGTAVAPAPRRLAVQPRLRSTAGMAAAPPPFPTPPATTLTSPTLPRLTPFPATCRLSKPPCHCRLSRSAPSTASLCHPLLHSLVQPPHLLPVRYSLSTCTAMSPEPRATPP